MSEFEPNDITKVGDIVEDTVTGETYVARDEHEIRDREKILPPQVKAEQIYSESRDQLLQDGRVRESLKSPLRRKQALALFITSTVQAAMNLKSMVSLVESGVPVHENMEEYADFLEKEILIQFRQQFGFGLYLALDQIDEGGQLENGY